MKIDGEHKLKPYAKLKVLICDDFALARLTLRQALADLGVVEMLEAGNGLEARDILLHQRNVLSPVDVVICDLNMPFMSGLELLKFVRADQIYSNTPFLMVTVEGSQQALQAAVAAGVTEVLIKPLSSATTGPRLDAALKKTQAKIATLARDSQLRSDVVHCTQITLQGYFAMNVSPSLEGTKIFKAGEDWLVSEMAMAQIYNGQKQSPEAILTVAFSVRTLEKILADHFPGRTTETLPLGDVIGELTNCIYGSIKTQLNARGYDFFIDLPVKAERTSEPQRLTQTPGGLEIPFESDAGSFYVCVGTVDPARWRMAGAGNEIK